MLVVVPVELAGEFRELHEGVIEFARDLRAPVIAEATERLAKIDFVHVGSLAYSVHESVRVPIRFIARSNTALSSSERAMTIAPWMASKASSASAAPTPFEAPLRCSARSRRPTVTTAHHLSLRGPIWTAACK